MTNVAQFEVPHWLMAAGTALVVLGALGLLIERWRRAKELTPSEIQGPSLPEKSPKEL